MDVDDQTIEDAFAAEEGVPVDKGDEYIEETPDAEPEAKASRDFVDEASKMGHTSKEDFVANGGDPERWKSPYEYVKYGELREKLDSQKAENDKYKTDTDLRINNLNALHDRQLESQLSALRDEQRQAVSEADTEKFDQVQKTIDQLETPVDNTKDPLIVQWEKDNEWSNIKGDPRLQAANGFMSGYMMENPRASTAEALAYVDKNMEPMLVAPENKRRSAPTGNERSTRAVNKSGKLHMGDITGAERALWNEAGADIWGGDEKAFLQSVKDSRKK